MKKFLSTVGTVLLCVALLAVFTWVAVEFFTGEDPLAPKAPTHENP